MAVTDKKPDSRDKKKEVSLESLNRKSDYFVRLTSFEGPLDLLLHLIKDAKLDIKDIFVSDITEQYLAYMTQLHTLDLERASEFIDVAAQLVEIKSRSLLPRLDDNALPPEEESEQDLIARLKEYKLLKEAGERLRAQEEVNRFYKPPDESVGDYRYVLKQMTLNGLLDAFSALLHKVERKALENPEKKIIKDRFTVAEKIMAIKDAVILRREVVFTELFDEEMTKSELINTFLALLELLKMQFIHVRQEGVFEEITITLAELAAGDESSQRENDDMME